MWPALIAMVLFGIAVTNLVLAIGMHKGKQWQILTAGNPAMPDGRLRYDRAKFRRSGEVVLWIYTAIHAAAAAAVFLTRAVHLLPSAVLAVVLYAAGGLSVLAAIGHLAYVDSYGQTAPEEEKEYL